MADLPSKPAIRDYYADLEVSHKDNVETIEKAYSALKTDLQSDSTRSMVKAKAVQLRQIEEAWACLSDTTKRSTFDTQRAEIRREWIMYYALLTASSSAPRRGRGRPRNQNRVQRPQQHSRPYHSLHPKTRAAQSQSREEKLVAAAQKGKVRIFRIWLNRDTLAEKYRQLGIDFHELTQALPLALVESCECDGCEIVRECKVDEAEEMDERLALGVFAEYLAWKRNLVGREDADQEFEDEMQRGVDRMLEVEKMAENAERVDEEVEDECEVLE
ncbi:unnamed protein product [Periconia digitata]|uniref:J domain-containing protein n=1 Tax=Periconia digitata TaxID=1303443 RepID=A0A9W4UJU0_9PLEO|nr:unnamed protein product [Periconia digitata]